MTTASQPDPHSGFGEAFVTYCAHIKEAEIARLRKALRSSTGLWKDSRDAPRHSGGNRY